MTRFTQAVNDTRGLSEEPCGEKRSLSQTIKAVNIKLAFKRTKTPLIDQNVQMCPVSANPKTLHLSLYGLSVVLET